MSDTKHLDTSLLLSYAAKELEDAEEIRHVEEHLAVCPDCRKTLKAVRVYLGRLEGLSAERTASQVDPEAIERVRQGVAMRIARADRRRRMVRIYRGMGFAAAASVLVLVGWSMRYERPVRTEGTSKDTPAPVASVATPSKQVPGGDRADSRGLVIHGVPGTLPHAPGKRLRGGYRAGAEEALIKLKKRFYTLLNVPIEKRDLDAFAQIAQEAESLSERYPATQEGLKAKNLQLRALEQAGEGRKARKALAEYLELVDRYKGTPEGLRIVRVNAEESMRCGDFRRALWLISLAKDRYKDEPEAEEWAAFREADCYVWMGRSRRAQELLAAFRKDHPENTEWNRRAQISLAYVYLKENQREKATKLLEGYVKKYPDDALAAYAQFSLGWVYQVENKPELAVLEYRKVLENYPTSAWTDKARVQIARLEEQVLKGMEPVLK